MKKRKAPPHKTRTGLAMALAMFLLIGAIVLAFPPQAMHTQSYALDPPSGDTIIPIPDANLNQVLHDACGTSQLLGLKVKDLAALTGALYISSKKISNLEGIQYCSNIEELHADSNPLTSFPDMGYMTSLVDLDLEACELTKFPVAVSSIPNLQVLRMPGNKLTDISGIDGCAKLRVLDLERNRLTKLPASISNLKSLEMLAISYNQLRELPAGLAGLPKFKGLYATDNQIRSFPAAFASNSIESINLTNNRITVLPDSLFTSGKLTGLNVRFNRIKNLPATISKINYALLDVSFNYLDISPGSNNLAVIKATAGTNIYYEQQMIPVNALKAEAEEYSISLQWTKCPDKQAVDYIAKVKNYEIYLNTGGALTALGTVDKDTTTFLETGLSPGTERSYAVAVVYDIVENTFYKVTSRSYSYISTQTLIPVTTTATTTTEPEMTQTTGEPIELTTQATSIPDDNTTPDTTKPIEENNGGPSIWLTVGLSILAVAGIISTVVLLVRQKKLKK